MDLLADDITEMSLDDYIAMCKIPNNNNDKKATDLDLNSSYTKFGRRKGNIDDDNDEDDEDNENNHENNDDCIVLDTETISQVECASTPKESSTIWKGPDTNISYIDCNKKQNDLRDKINNNRTKPSSVQYRLMAPNNSTKRPMGLPALLPLDAYVQHQTYNGYRNRGFRRRRGGRGRRREGGFNNFDNIRSPFNGVNNGRVQRNRNQDVANRNLNFSFDVHNVNERESNKSSQLNLTIGQPSELITLTPSAKLNSNRCGNFNANNTNRNNNDCRLLPFGNLTPQAESALNMCGSDTSMGNDSLKNMLGFHGNLSGDMMSTFAQRLLDIAKCTAQSTVHKPIYDMKVQKDIHAIQKKKLLYKCPGGDIVSSDGIGINCEIIPRTSGISMNCRFA